MNRRYVVMALAVVAALSLSLPAFGASPNQLAKKALHMAKKADKRSKRADSRAKRALRRAGKRGPNGSAGPTGPIGLQAAVGQTGQTGQTGATGQTGQTGSVGPTGPAGTARAFAQVSPTGPSYASARTKNFSGSPGRPSAGVYCLIIEPATGIDPEAVAAVASPESGNSGDHGGSAEVRGAATGSCSAGQFAIHTYDSSGLASNNIGFTIIVP
jgi:hypothetical protein